MPDQPALIVVGASARSLAASAARAGFAPLAIDVFGDSDTRALSAASICLEGGLARGLSEAALIRAIDAMLEVFRPIGIVYCGFDDRPYLIAAMGRRARVIGNHSATMARAKNPWSLARLCAECGVLHPEIAAQAPSDPTGWLVKKRGGSGGAHIHDATPDDRGAPGHYFQRRISGEGCSALFAADGESAEIIGLSAQWTAPTRLQPFRYGGAVGPISLPPAQTKIITHTIRSLTPRLGLVGLNSADFIVDGEAVWLLEINARLGATLDVFDSFDGGLTKRHIAACEGRLTPHAPAGPIKAAAIVYAPGDIVVRDSVGWPAWAADRSMTGIRISSGEPLCTVFATGPTVDLARSCVAERARSIVALMGAAAA